jgi:hypothetical protein
LQITETLFSATRTAKNITGRIDGNVEQYSATLARLRQEFIAHATVTTEVAVLETQEKVNAQLTGMSTQALDASA